jgi:ATP-dependent helicase/nuclease subunit B
MNLVIGKPKTGKSKYIYNRMDEDVLNGKKVIYFVPSQTRSMSEENYMNLQNKSGVIDINITTISTYIKSNLNNLNSNDNRISKLDRKLLLYKLIANNPKIFKLYDKVKFKEGFIETLNIYMDIFKKEQINLDNITSLELDNKLLDLKFKEILNVYSNYLKISENYIDSIDEYDIFLKEFENSEFDTNLNIYFDGYNNFSYYEFKFIKLLIKKGYDITISITTDLLDELDVEDINIRSVKEKLLKEHDIFTIPNNTILNLLKYCIEEDNKVNIISNINDKRICSDDIRYLSDNIFNLDIDKKIDSNNINISLTTNIYTEIESIASTINKKIIEEEYKYSDFVIYTTNLKEYEYCINKIFYEYNIPFYIDFEIETLSNILIKYILKLIELSKNEYNSLTMFELLKYGLNDISFEDISYLENYCLEMNINEYKFKKEFVINNNYDIDRLNIIRNNIIDTFDDFFKEIKKQSNIKDIISSIYSHLETKNILKNYSNSLNIINSKIDNNSKYMSLIFKKMWDNLCDVFASLVKIYDNEKIDINEFEKVFKLSIKDISVKGIPPTLDCVNILDINVSKTDIKKQMFLVGVNENKFPIEVSEDVIFNDTELEKLENLGIKFKENSINKINMGLYNIYETLHNVSEKIYISFLSSDIDGKSLRPSNIINNITNILNVKIFGDVTKDTQNEIYSKKAILERLILLLNSEEITDELLSLYMYACKYLDLNDIIEYNRSDDRLNDNTLIKIFGNEFTTSVSKLELFKKCPFSYFMKYGLKLKERNIYKITSLDTGNFMHNVLEQFSKFLYENKIAWHEILIDNDKYSVILNEIIEKELNKVFIKYLDSIKYNILKEKLIKTMNKVVTTIAKSYNQSRFIPLGYEIEFKKDGIYAPIEIKLKDRTMYIIGKIDRVDILDNKYIRVVDYKSSSRDLKLDDIKEGISLQLVTYLSSIISNVKDSIPSAMLYFNLSDKQLSLKDYTKDNEKIEKMLIKKLRMKGIFLKDVNILNLMDNKIETDEKLIDANIKTALSNKNTNKYLEQDDFVNLCDNVKNILSDIGNEILQGIVKINPNKKCNHCKNCEFSKICRKENLI